MAKTKMTPNETIAEMLVAEGVDHVSGIVGSAFMDMLALFPEAGIEFAPVGRLEKYSKADHRN